MDDVKHIVYWLTGFVGALITLFSGEWEFVIPSVTTVTATNFKASSVNGVDGKAISTSHVINYIAIGTAL